MGMGYGRGKLGPVARDPGRREYALSRRGGAVPIIGTSQKNEIGKNDEAGGPLRWVKWNVWEVFGSSKAAGDGGNFCASCFRNGRKSGYILTL